MLQCNENRHEKVVNPQPLTNAELDKLADVLKRLADKRAMNLETLDGFFAALICGDANGHCPARFVGEGFINFSRNSASFTTNPRVSAWLWHLRKVFSSPHLNCSNAPKPFGRTTRRLQTSHGIFWSELVLKAFITTRRPLTQDELNGTFGHDLTKLLDEAVRLGLTISPSAQSDTEKLTEAHMEYLVSHPIEAANRVLVIEHFVGRHVAELFKAVRLKIATHR
jgi:hypothetical protein